MCAWSVRRCITVDRWTGTYDYALTAKSGLVSTNVVFLQIEAFLLNPADSAGVGAQTPVASTEPAAGEDFFEMSIEQLMDVEVGSPATLTPASARMAPAAVTTITREQILASGDHTAPVETQREWGLELEATYHTDRTVLNLSQGFTKLYDFDLEPGMSTVNTAEPYGYGDDLANGSNHVTKVTGRYKLDDDWTLDGSLRIYRGFPGLENYNDYMPGAMGQGSTPAIEPGWEKAYRGNYDLNLGLQYQPNGNLTLRVEGYYLLGIFDEDLNKRNYYTSVGDYRSHAPAVASG